LTRRAGPDRPVRPGRGGRRPAQRSERWMVADFAAHADPRVATRNPSAATYGPQDTPAPAGRPASVGSAVPAESERIHMNATCAISATAEAAAAAVAAVPRRVTRLTATSNIMTTRPRKSTGATLRTSITDVMSSAVKDPESAWSHGRYRLISASASPAVATSAPIRLVRWGTTFLRSCARVGRADRCGAGAE